MTAADADDKPCKTNDVPSKPHRAPVLSAPVDRTGVPAPNHVPA